MSAFELGWIAAIGLAVVVRVLVRRRDEPAEPRRDLGTLAILAGAFLAQLIIHHLRDPTWVPHGADWDQWLFSVLAIGRDAPYPMERWPAYGLIARIFDLLAPGPTFRNVAVFSHLATAATAAGLYRLGRTLVGPAGGLAAAVLVTALPVVLQISGWCSSYSLWLAATVWTATGLCEAVRTRHPAWWAVTGLAYTLIPAIMPKGLLIGLAVGPVVLLAWALRGAPRLRTGAALALPFVLISLVYVVFPAPLMPLESHVSRIAQNRARPPETETFDDQIGKPPPPPQGEAAAQDEGYVFGRSMAPWTVMRAIQTARTARNQSMAVSWRGRSGPMLEQMFPRVGRASLAVIALAPLLALGLRLRHWRFTVLAWGAVLAVIAGTAPGVFAEFNYRFLLPIYALAVFLAVVPVAALVGDRRGPLRWLPAALPLLAFLPGSPWGDTALVKLKLTPVEFRGDTALTVYHELRALPDRRGVDVVAPLRVGMLALDARKGSLYSPNRYEMEADLPLRADRYVLAIAPEQRHSVDGPGHMTYQEVAPACLPQLEADRVPVTSWRIHPSGTPLILYGPLEDGGGGG